LLFCTIQIEQCIDIRHLYNKEVKENIDATKFTWQELAAIEHAFERNTNIRVNSYDFSSPEEIRADQIRGLEAVVKVMLTFDECTENVQEVFTNKAELIPIN